jgi:outer membrane protein
LEESVIKSSLVCVLMLAAACAAAQETKIGYVNTGRIEAESVQAKRAIEAMKKEFEPRERQIVEMQKGIKADQERFEKGKATLPAAELKTLGTSITNRMRESDQLVFSLQADIEQRRKERAARLFEEANAVITSIAEQGKYDLIVHEAAFARTTVDITNLVLKEMARRAGN